MGKPKNNQSGFSTVEVVLIVLIIGLIGFVGWYVHQARNKANGSYNNAAANPVKRQSITDKPSGWLTCKSTHSSLKFMYPPSWHLKKNDLSSSPSWMLEDVSLLGEQNFTLTFILEQRHTLPLQNFLCTKTYAAMPTNVTLNSQYILSIHSAVVADILDANTNSLIPDQCGATQNAVNPDTEFTFRGSYSDLSNKLTDASFLAKPEIQTTKAIFSTLQK